MYQLIKVVSKMKTYYSFVVITRDGYGYHNSPTVVEPSITCEAISVEEAISKLQVKAERMYHPETMSAKPKITVPEIAK